MPGVGPVENANERLDRCRRAPGRHLDALGLGPLETPSRPVVAAPCLTLNAYLPAPAPGTPLLLVPAPIKRAYLWDLAPWASVVRRCLAGGLGVYLLQWEQPGERECGLGLADYADRLLLECVDAIRGETGRASVVLAGHSLGGTLAALFAALHHERMAGLIVLGAPLRFGQQVGALGPVVAASPDARLLTAALGNVPGSKLDEICWLAAPGTFGWSRWLDWLSSLAEPAALRTHLLVERWTLDELAVPGRLLEEVVEWLYREDRFMRGTLALGGRPVAPRQVTAPLLSVVDRRCPIAPPRPSCPSMGLCAAPSRKSSGMKGTGASPCSTPGCWSAAPPTGSSGRPSSAGSRPVHPTGDPVRRPPRQAGTAPAGRGYSTTITGRGAATPDGYPTTGPPRHSAHGAIPQLFSALHLAGRLSKWSRRCGAWACCTACCTNRASAWHRPLVQEVPHQPGAAAAPPRCATGHRHRPTIGPDHPDPPGREAGLPQRPYHAGHLAVVSKCSTHPARHRVPPCR
jgi:polyhydroxyalkanoate synthase